MFLVLLPCLKLTLLLLTSHRNLNSHEAGATGLTTYLLSYLFFVPLPIVGVALDESLQYREPVVAWRGFRFLAWRLIAQARIYQEIFMSTRLSPVDFLRLMDISERRLMLKGNDLIQEGRPHEEVFLIVEGTTEVSGLGCAACTKVPCGACQLNY